MLPSSCNTRFLKRVSRSVRLLPTNRHTWIYNVAQRSKGRKMHIRRAALAPTPHNCITSRRRPSQGRSNAHAGSRTRVTSMGGLYDTATLRALLLVNFQWGYFEMPYSKRGRPPILHGPNSWMPCQLSFRVRLREHNNCGAKRRHST